MGALSLVKHASPTTLARSPHTRRVIHRRVIPSRAPLPFPALRAAAMPRTRGAPTRGDASGPEWSELLQRWLDELFPGQGWSVEVTERAEELRRSSKRRDDVHFTSPAGVIYRTYEKVIQVALLKERHSWEFLEAAAQRASGTPRTRKREASGDTSGDEDEGEAEAAAQAAPAPQRRAAAAPVSAREPRAAAAPASRAPPKKLKEHVTTPDKQEKTLLLPLAACARDILARTSFTSATTAVKLLRFVEGSHPVVERTFNLCEGEPLEDLLQPGGAGVPGELGLTVQLCPRLDV
jgi:hypothetical protein